MNTSNHERSPAEHDLRLGLIGGTSIWHWLIVLVVVVLLFGRGKISDVMGDFAKGIKSFKRGIAEDDPSAVSGPRLREREAGTAATGHATTTSPESDRNHP